MPRVLIGGTFDPLHAGHLAYFRVAETMGSVVCAVSDNRAKHPPLVPLTDRAHILTALGMKCEIVSDENLAPLLQRLVPDVYLTGRDWEGNLPHAEVRTCAAFGIEIRHCDERWNSSSALLASYERARNAEKLAALETFVGQQVPASKPWEPVTPYDFESRKAIEGPHAQIIKDTFQPRRVLDVGCGPGHLVKMLIGVGVPCVGADLPFFDVSEPVARRDSVADLVICREVMEHLTVRQLAIAVRNLVKLSSRYVYVTTRFTAGSHLLEFDVADDLDPTHITLLQQDFLRTLFVLEGCMRRADLEAALDHRKLGRVMVYQVPA